jgi:transcriptional regulator with XRE-family HTH domain
MGKQEQIRYCRCGSRLARDNKDLLCSACQRSTSVTRSVAPSVPPDFWTTDQMRDALASQNMGEVIRAYRIHHFHGQQIPQSTVARWVNLSQAQLSRIEKGRAVHDLRRLAELARALRIPSQLLWFRLGDPEKDDVLVTEEQVSTTLRRDFVALGISSVASSAISSPDSDHELFQMTLDRGTASEHRVSNLEAIADDLGVAAGRSPEDVLQSALSALRSIRILLTERQATRQQTRLVRVSSKLSAVVGEILQMAGQFPKSREWYKTAEHAAFDAGDRYQADLALGGHAQLFIYSAMPREALSLLESRLDLSRWQPTPAIAFLWGLRARAHATLNEPGAFARAIDSSQDALERSSQGTGNPGEGILSFRPAKLAFYEATGAVSVKDSCRAIAAADRALSLFDENITIDSTLTRLEKASALAGSGDMAEGCKVAAAALLSPGTYHTAAVRTYASKFDGLTRTVSSPEAQEWRDVRAYVHARKTR